MGYEWPGELWRRAALHAIDLAIDLAQAALSLENPAPFHVQFDGDIPTWIHPGAIRAQECAADTIRALTGGFLVPLYLHGSGKAGILRNFLRDGDTVPVGFNPGATEVVRIAEERTGREAASETLRWMRGLAGQIRLPDAETQWSGYYLGDPPLDVSPEWGYKRLAMDKLFELLRPRTVLDLGANTGWYSRLAAKWGARVTAVDGDAVCANRLCRMGGARKILPLCFDFSAPDPGTCGGLYGFPSATERLRSELVIALAVEHHLVLSAKRFSFEMVASLFAQYTRRWLAVEFVPFAPNAMNPYSPDSRPGCTGWYCMKAFVGALRSQFREVDVAPGPSDGRQILICEL